MTIPCSRLSCWTNFDRSFVGGQHGFLVLIQEEADPVVAIVGLTVVEATDVDVVGDAVGEGVADHAGVVGSIAQPGARHADGDGTGGHAAASAWRTRMLKISMDSGLGSGPRAALNASATISLLLVRA